MSAAAAAVAWPPSVKHNFVRLLLLLAIAIDFNGSVIIIYYITIRYYNSISK
jgi:hypothetical protein